MSVKCFYSDSLIGIIHTYKQKELKQLMTKADFVQLLSHCQKKCGGKKLQELLQVPAERVSHGMESCS